jgi:hypothetical protein
LQAGAKIKDKSDSKRKEGIRTILQRTMDLSKESNEAGIRNILIWLAEDFCGSSSIASRVGGLLALSTIAAAMTTKLDPMLDVVVTAATTACGDERREVRFSGIETLCNLARSLKKALLRPDLFRLIFHVMLATVNDDDGPIARGSATLSLQMLEVAVTNVDDFPISEFLSIFETRCRTEGTHSRQVLLMWLNRLDTVPTIDMVDHLSSIIGPIFVVLSDSSGQVRNEAHTTLAALLRQVETMEDEQLHSRIDFSATVQVLVESSTS